MSDNQQHGILYDTLFHKDFPAHERKAIISRLNALFSTQIGKQVLADIDGLVIPSVVSYAELSDPSKIGALIAHEAQRKFWTQLKAIRETNVGTKPVSRGKFLAE